MRARGLLLVVAIALGAACRRDPPPPSAPIPRLPILETVVRSDDIAAQDAQGLYRVLPLGGRWLRLRLWSDGPLRGAVNGAALARTQGNNAAGWTQYQPSTITDPGRGTFGELVVRLPDRVDGNCTLTVNVLYDSPRADAGTFPQLNVALGPVDGAVGCPSLPRRASTVFDDGGENSKPEGRARSQIVKRDVVLAGWLYDPADPSDPSSPHRNHGEHAAANESEDYHYDLFLDDDFLHRNYGGVGPVRPPLVGMSIPVPDPEPAGYRRMPLVPPEYAGLNVTSLVTAGLFYFPVELNGWHTAARGAKPAGWVDDPDQAFNGNAWPFHPTRTLGLESGRELQPGDYVIVSGTLWQDTWHREPFRECFDRRIPGHSAWLEIHPVDSVRAVSPPSRRKQPILYAMCAPPGTTAAISRTAYLQPPPAPDPNAVLRFEVQADSRYTHPNTLYSARVDSSCEDRLRVEVTMPPSGTFKAIYLLWWEPGTQPRPTCTIAIPAASPVLGPGHPDGDPPG